MILDENWTFYDILDISPDATSQEIREAYIRIKSTYNRDNLVLYSLVTPEEREETLKKIEIANIILSDREKRRDYDENNGIHGFLNNPFAHEETPSSQENIVSIDRVPPMELSSQDNDILVPPSTDFGELRATSPVPLNATSASQDSNTTLPSNRPFSVNQDPFRRAEQAKSEDKQASFYDHTTYHARESEKSQTRVYSPYKSHTALPQIGAELTREIELETEWHGPLLKRIREAYKISIEDLSNTTKITKTYLHAIEADNFAKLPAPVYVRGFVTQIAKALQLIPERVVPVYMARFKATLDK